jgi:predicted Zn-dependent protease
VEASVNAKPQTDRAIDQLAMMKAKLVGFIGPATRVMSAYPASDQSIYAKYARAIAAYRAVDIKASLKGTEELIALRPDNPYFYELKGQILYESGKAEESIEPHRRSVELAPDQALLKVNLARSLATITAKEGENLAEAEGLLIDALALERDNPYAWTFLADVYAKQKRIGDADLATAEAAYHLGDMARAHNFARRAMKNLPPGTPNATRADDILALSDPRGLRAQRGRPG